MNILALDIGLRRTGVAFADSDTQIPLSLDTIQHNGIEDLLDPVLSLIKEKKIDHVVLGLPLLPSGEEGEQCEIVRLFGNMLEGANLQFSYLDERYTSFQTGVDSDASAANMILLTYLEQNS